MAITYIDTITSVAAPGGNGDGDVYPILNNDNGIIGLGITVSDFSFDIVDDGVVGVIFDGKFALVDLNADSIPDVTTRATQLLEIGWVGIDPN